ncbi:hypothetical protein AAC387_Pa02g3276 [Persea americana]
MSSGPSFHSSSLSSGTCALSGSGISRTTAEPIDGMARPTAPFIYGLLVRWKDGCLFSTTTQGNGTCSRMKRATFPMVPAMSFIGRHRS